jgi:hypothetical protein
MLLLVIPVQAQKLIPNSSVTGVCYAGNKINRIYIPPPDSFFKKSGSKSGGSITVYYTGFSSQGIAAVEYAVSILETMLPADTKMTIKASWEKISTAGVLANSSITGYAGGWGIDALNPLALYPVALAEKIAGESLNDDLQGDFIITVNNSINWYLGTDGKPPDKMYDLVTVVLHEVCHGLGFFDSMNISNTYGHYGYSIHLMLNDSVPIINDTIPMIYDTFIENLAGKRLTDTLQFINNSGGLTSQITGGQLYFNGPLLKYYTSGSRARLYVPSVFSTGSSIAHLDEATTLEPNTLMTPYVDLAEAIHDPGKLTFSILGDLGWINTRIIHQPMDDTEENISQVHLSAIIKSDTAYNRNKVGAVFSFDGFRTSDTLWMVSPDESDTFKITLNLPSYNTELQYYFFTEDCFLRLYRSPSFFNKLPYKVYIGADTVKPLILHTPAEYYLESQIPDSLKLEATVADNNGVDSVYIEYRKNNGPSKYIGLKLKKPYRYSTVFDLSHELLAGGDSLQYRIFASDSAHISNVAVLPKTGYFVINIEDIGSTLINYSTDFTGATNDFFNIGFNISKPAGFSKYGLHTRHPYESPEIDNDSIEYTAMLRHPLKFNASGMLIDFRELVLVEPGDPGSVFGSSDFYDYVILEGSKDFGKTWFGMQNGYDCRYTKSWESAYNSSVTGNNSTFTGTEGMLVKHSLFYHPSANIAAGDTILLRFRLFSDPYANGWGWVIEDLNINSLVDAVEKIEDNPVVIYPNPGRGLIRINADVQGKTGGKSLRYSIFNSTGTCIVNNYTYDYSETLVDISDYPPGFYIIVLYRDDGIKRIKYTLIK